MGLDLQAFAPYLAVIEIVLAVVITVLVILQSKGGGMEAITGGSDGGGFRTKRGLEAAMHRWTIYFSIAFFVLTFFAFIAMGQSSAALTGGL